MSTLACSVTDCPFRDGGACLEAFEDPADCPNTQDETETTDLEPELGQSPTPDEDLEASTTGLASSFVSFQSGESLGLSQANDLRARRQCRFVLVAGEVDAGKSTLLVELFAQFLKGPFESWDFAGSSTLGAFNSVHASARESSGNQHPDTPRTADEGMRFLHLALSDCTRRDILFSELSGERFKGLIDGAMVAEQIPVAGAADRCVLLIDGERMTAASTRSRAFARARRLIGALTEKGGLLLGTHLLILASKADLWLGVADDEVRVECDLLVEFAEGRGLQVSWETLAVRPLNTSPVIGLSRLVAWMFDATTESETSDPGKRVTEGRRFWQDRDE